MDGSIIELARITKNIQYQPDSNYTSLLQKYLFEYKAAESRLTFYKNLYSINKSEQQIRKVKITTQVFSSFLNFSDQIWISNVEMTTIEHVFLVCEQFGGNNIIHLAYKG